MGTWWTFSLSHYPLANLMMHIFFLTSNFLFLPRIEHKYDLFCIDCIAPSRWLDWYNHWSIHYHWFDIMCIYPRNYEFQLLMFIKHVQLLSFSLYLRNFKQHNPILGCNIAVSSSEQWMALPRDCIHMSLANASFEDVYKQCQADPSHASSSYNIWISIWISMWPDQKRMF